MPEFENAETIWQCNWVRITEPSEDENIQMNDGTQVATIFQIGSNACDKQYAPTTFCILDIAKDLKIDPQKGAKSQAALLSLTGVIDADTDSDEQGVKQLFVDDVQLLSPAEAELLKLMLVKNFAALSGQVSRKREHDHWSPEENTAKASPCRV